MSKFIYCGYPDETAADFVIQMSEKGVIPKPSGGFVLLDDALENFPDTYTILKIELNDDAELDEYFAASCTEKWKIYKSLDVVSMSTYQRTEG